MKTRSFAVLFLVIVILSGFFACKTAEPFDADAVFNRLLSEVQYQSSLEDMGDFASLLFGDLPEGTEVRIYAADGKYTDAVILFKAPSAGDTAAVKASLDGYLDSIGTESRRYNPEEAAKIDNAVIRTIGQYVFCCITADHAAAAKILSER